jgi:hypothetical protein
VIFVQNVSDFPLLLSDVVRGGTWGWVLVLGGVASRDREVEQIGGANERQSIPA